MLLVASALLAALGQQDQKTKGGLVDSQEKKMAQVVPKNSAQAQAENAPMPLGQVQPKPSAGASDTSELKPIQIPENDRRGEDQTFLTFPEWFLVFSPDEMATALEKGAAPSSLPWMTHAGQAWSSYAEVASRVSAGGYGFNGGYHAMIMVIAASTSVEYALRGLYEITLGRVFEMFFGHKTAEDALEVKEARRYVSFIKERPWYEFDFKAGIKELWAIGQWDEPAKGSVPRRIERLSKLTVEWGVKAAYGWLVGLGTGAAYDKPVFTSVAVLVHLGVREVVALARYEGFTKASMELAAKGVDFESICGNSGSILVSMVMEDSAWPPSSGATALFEQRIPTRPRFKRVAFEVQVAKLAEVLRWAQKDDSKAVVEHVFDY